MLKRIPSSLFVTCLISMPILGALLFIGVGRYSISMLESLKVLYFGLLQGGEGVSQQSLSVVINMRLPRILMALLCGGGLAVAGASQQAMFSNSLTSPDTLGVASGASFGAALALLLDGNLVVVQISALIFGLAAVAFAYSISKSQKGGTSIIMLVLSGIVVSALFQALVSLVKYVADTEDQLPAITYWLMGSLTSATFHRLAIGAPPIIISCIVLFAIRWKMNVLSLAEDEAKSLGINVMRIRIIIIIATSMITASSVSMCGQIGWVGLLIPHVCRMLFGSNNKQVIPACISLGMVFMLVIDTIARSASSTEIPVSILTAVIGAPCFITLLKKTRGGWS